MGYNPLYIASLNSGSNGNCYYVGTDTEAVLVDAGLSCRETEKRMSRIGLSMQQVRAIFISHEHTDHVKGLCTLSAKYNLPVYITPGTLSGCRFNLRENLIRMLCGNSTIQVGAFTISSFAKIHDAQEPHSFMISCNGVNIGVFTDIGDPCAQLISHFSQCHAAFLEANYDEGLLSKSTYPYFLKRRISGGRGHLSNEKALNLFNSHRPPFMSHLFLSHLSKDNNCPDLVKRLFDQYSVNTEIIIASRYSETEVYAISGQAAGRSA